MPHFRIHFRKSKFRCNSECGDSSRFLLMHFHSMIPSLESCQRPRLRRWSSLHRCSRQLIVDRPWSPPPYSPSPRSEEACMWLSLGQLNKKEVFNKLNILKWFNQSKVNFKFRSIFYKFRSILNNLPNPELGNANRAIYIYLILRKKG